MTRRDQQQLLTRHIHHKADVEVHQAVHNGRVVWFRITSMDR
ncbi:MAG: hypothetical protein QW428_00950 [Conexivisphaerales archaeon]